MARTWCCPILQDLVDCAGQRGLSLVATLRDGVPIFYLQGRGVDLDVPPLDVAFPVTRVSQRAIAYCPGCGEKLASFYGDRIEHLVRDDLIIQ